MITSFKQDIYVDVLFCEVLGWNQSNLKKEKDCEKSFCESRRGDHARIKFGAPEFARAEIVFHSIVRCYCLYLASLFANCHINNINKSER